MCHGLKKKLDSFDLFEADLARVYGWTPHLIESLEFNTASKYHAAIKQLRAREMLDQIQVASHPHMSIQQQRKLIDSLNRDLYDDFDRPVLTTAELSRRMNGA